MLLNEKVHLAPAGERPLGFFRFLRCAIVISGLLILVAQDENDLHIWKLLFPATSPVGRSIPAAPHAD